MYGEIELKIGCLVVDEHGNEGEIVDFSSDGWPVVCFFNSDIGCADMNPDEIFRRHDLSSEFYEFS